MNLKKILVFSLSIVASLTIVGIGFSSWYFAKNNIENNASVAVHVYSEVTKGDISIVKAPSMVSFSNGIGKKEDLRDGLEFYREENSSYVKDDKIVLKYTIQDANDSIEGNDFKLFADISSTTTDSTASSLTDIIDITSTYEDAESDTGYDFAKEVKKVEDSGLGYFQYTLALNDVIEYKSQSVKPLTSESYQNLCDAIKNGTTTITIKFVVK